MRRRNERRKPYSSVRLCSAAEWRLLGIVLIAAGMVLLFLCIPGWAWAALIGAGLVAAGLWMAK